MLIKQSALTRAAMAGLVAMGLSIGSAMLPARANVEVVPLKRLQVKDVILLPTVSSKYEATFTKPMTWQLSGKTFLTVDFQHSIELQPHRSWLQIKVNDQVLKHIPLTKDNAEGTRLTIPMPVALLKDFNTLTFQVQQHYTDRCEDPLDKSLWTQILPSTQLVFDYQPVVPKVDLAGFPYPIIDTLTYSPAMLHYITGGQPAEKELQAMALVNAHLAQQAQNHEVMTRVSFNNPAGSAQEQLIFVGKGADINSVSRFASAFGAYALQGGQWVDKNTGQVLSQNQGLVLFFQVPGSKSQTVLVVTGNSDEAVLKAAQMLTLTPQASQMTGQALVVPEGWNPPGGRSTKVPRFIESQTRSFRELGFGIQEVHKINAPPIQYQLPVVTRFLNTNGKLWVDLNYSYSPNLNPEFSSLELRMNDVSIANIPLTNTAGESAARFTAPIPPELLKPRNEMVAQFHLMPDKYGWCVDNYVDNAWGKIMDDSQFRVEGTPVSYLPNTGLLNNTMYPYSKEDSLEKVHLALPANPSEALLDAMLGFTTRLGRATMADTDLRLTLSKGGAIPTDKNVAVFRLASENLNLPKGAQLLWQAVGSLLTKKLELNDPAKGTISGEMAELGNGNNLEQYSLGGEQVISVFTAGAADGFLKWGQWLETDAQFDELASGFLQQLSPHTKQLNAISELQYHQEQKGAAVTVNWWDAAINWLKNLPWMWVIGGLVGGLFLLILLPLLVRALFRR